MPLEAVLDLANIVMLFLLAVVGVALRYGRGPAALASFLNVAAFDFFFVPPRLSFSVADVQYVLTFVRHARRRPDRRPADRRAALPGARRDAPRASLARAVRGGARPVERADDRAGGRGRRRRGQRANSALAPIVFVLDANDRLLSPVAAAEAPALDAGTARWAFDHRQPAGLGTDTLPGSAWLYLPLKAPMRTRGVLALRPEDPRLLLVPEQRRQLETFAALTAIALERVHYVDVAQQRDGADRIGAPAQLAARRAVARPAHAARRPGRPRRDAGR